MNRAAAFAFLVCCLAATAAAQDSTAVAPDTLSMPDTTGTVAVASNLPTGLVYLDGAFLGHAGDGRFNVPAGAHRLEIVEPEPEAWRSRRGAAEVTVRAGEAVEVRLDVPYRYRIESVPYGATVTLRTEGGEEVLGTTPLVVERAAPLEGELALSKPGFVTLTEAPGRAETNRHTVVLHALRADPGGAGEVAWRPRKPNRWIDYAAAGVAAAAAAAAIYYKFEADDLYDRYVETGDPALRPEFERYDDYSAVALGVSTAAFVTLGVRLVLR